MASVYQIAHLTKIYKGASKKANDDLSLTIEKGEIFGLLGPNGAGKSTLVHQITGLIGPTSGTITLFGVDLIKHPTAVSHYIALQPQHAGALRDLYPEEALLYTARLRGIASAVARKQMEELIEELGLQDCRRKRISQLSGGQSQLVNLAVSFIGNRPVMVFDEPTNNLDPVVRRQIWEKLLQLNRQGTTIILVTHNVLEAERVIQRVGIINDGRLLALGTPGELKARVDQRVRLELILKTEDTSSTPFLQSLGDAHSLTPQHWAILCSQEHMQERIDQIVRHIGLKQLDDLRIMTPSLEDVYIQLGGGQKLE